MAEVIVFLLVGTVAVLAAALMLISENAVHSAMFLVLNFVCVAFFFLTLSAPFIALVQVAVYGGAIMVLFLFVIMLLGAERVAPTARRLAWLPRAAVVLALVFLVTVGGALASGEINFNQPPPPEPQVRVLHAADTPVDVYFNNQPFMEGMDFREVSEYTALPVGEYGVTAFPAGADPATESPAILGDFVLAEGDVITLALLGAGGVYQVTPLHDQIGPTEDGEARLTLINGMPDLDAIDLIDPVSPFNEDDDEILIPQAGFGDTVETLLLDPARATDLVVRESNPDDPDVVVEYNQIELAANTNNLLVVARQELTGDQSRVVPMQIVTPTEPLFGSPQQVAGVLFSDYLLPFELVSVLLLVAMVGAIVLTRDELVRETARRRVVRRPLVGPQAAVGLTGAAKPEESAAESGD